MTAVTLGANRQFWLAALTDAHPTYSFLEDAVGTTKRAAQYGRQIRLGDPINVGPNSTWHQLTWEGGEGQDVWNDTQMYQWGNMNVLTKSGKVQPWPGLQSWHKIDNTGNIRWCCFGQGNRSDIADWQEAMYYGLGDCDIDEPRAPKYDIYRLQGGYDRADTRTVQWLGSNTEPFRFILPMLDDTSTNNVLMVATATRMFMLTESTHTFTEDTNAPVTTSAGYQYMHNSAVSFNGAMYYAHGNRLMKRLPTPPYGVLGTHTVVFQSKPARFLKGMCVWNNRIYFGVQYPNNRTSVYVTDGATVTKVFDFPQQFRLQRMKPVAGSLYIIGSQSSDIAGNSTTTNGYGNIVQQLWRYDGSGLKLLWHQGEFSDGQNRWASDLTEYQGMVCWARQGTFGSESAATANLMFYDPVRDAIVRGPGLLRDAQNIGGGFGQGIWITALASWHNTIVMHFRDDTLYGAPVNTHAGFWSGANMIATMRAPNYPRDDLRYSAGTITTDVPQFAPSTGTKYGTLVSSEYHGDNDVAIEQKTWLSVRVRLRFTGTNSRLKVYVIAPQGDEESQIANSVLIGQVAFSDAAVAWRDPNFGQNSTTIWKDVTIPVKDNTGAYIQSQKIQVLLRYENFSTDYDDTSFVQIDDVAVQWRLAPHKVRQWQIRVPVTEAQQRLDNSANPLSTADTLAQKLEDLFFASEPVKFWEPDVSASTPADNTYVEANIIDFQRQEARLASNETGEIGYVTLTLVENVVT